MIALEIDAAHARHGAFGNLKDEIDPVLRLLDDLRRHGRGKTARTAIDLDDALHIALHPAARENGARLGLDLVGDLLIIDGAVALENHPVDDRVFLHPHHHLGALVGDLHIREQAGCEQGLDRQVHQTGVIDLARLDQQVGQDGIGLDALIAFHQDLADYRALWRLGLGSRRWRALLLGRR